MSKQYWFMLALAGASAVSQLHADNFADEVVSYHPGSGYAVRYTNLEAVLGEPSRVNPFADLTDPFNPPYGTNQILSVGTGGWGTVELREPIHNHPRNSFGLDFTIFGNSGFIITNEFDFTTFDWVGTPATDGSLFGHNEGETRVLVSRDGLHFYELDQGHAPTVDFLFPTAGDGDFGRPVHPGLTQDDFAGLTVDQIRALYNGSAGGASYDISWARDAQGRRVFLPFIRFIRVEVLSGKSEIDGFAAVERPRRGDWEEDALIELDSFQAVTARLEDAACTQTGTDGETALVHCAGRIILSYDNEDQELDLSVRTYQVTQEGGDWLVCGVR